MIGGGDMWIVRIHEDKGALEQIERLLALD